MATARQIRGWLTEDDRAAEGAQYAGIMHAYVSDMLAHDDRWLVRHYAR